jgi:hypothetical protein
MQCLKIDLVRVNSGENLDNHSSPADSHPDLSLLPIQIVRMSRERVGRQTSGGAAQLGGPRGGPETWADEYAIERSSGRRVRGNLSSRGNGDSATRFQILFTLRLQGWNGVSWKQKYCYVVCLSNNLKSFTTEPYFHPMTRGRPSPSLPCRFASGRMSLLPPQFSPGCS